MSLAKWQIEAIRKELKIQKSHLSGKFRLDFKYDAIFLSDAIERPYQLISEINEQFVRAIEHKKALIQAILESGTQAEWREKRLKLNGRNYAER